MLYSREKGIVLVSGINNSLYYLENILYIPKLGVNLISAKKLYKGSYKGAFNEENIWITKGNRNIINTE